jgi:hypothetical protein
LHSWLVRSVWTNISSSATAKNANEVATMMPFSATAWKHSYDGSISTSDESQPISLSKLISTVSRIISTSDLSRVISHSSKNMFNLSTKPSQNIVIVNSLAMITAMKSSMKLQSLSREKSHESVLAPANVRHRKKQLRQRMKQ